MPRARASAAGSSPGTSGKARSEAAARANVVGDWYACPDDAANARADIDDVQRAAMDAMTPDEQLASTLAFIATHRAQRLHAMRTSGLDPLLDHARQRAQQAVDMIHGPAAPADAVPDHLLREFHSRSGVAGAWRMLSTALTTLGGRDMSAAIGEYIARKHDDAPSPRE